MTESKEMIEGLNEIKFWLFEKTNKMMSYWKDIFRKKKTQCYWKCENGDITITVVETK